MLMALAETLSSSFGEYYAKHYRQGKIGLMTFFWRMVFIVMGTFLVAGFLSALLYDYQYPLDHWVRSLAIIVGGSFALVFFLTVLLWLISKKTKKSLPETPDSDIRNNAD